MRAATDDAPRAGAVVVRVVDGIRRYLLVGPKNGGAEWLLPKGHCESGETPEATALREAAEEGGVRTALICSLGRTTLPGKNGAAIKWFLVTHIADEPCKENRAACWLPYQQAREALCFAELRVLLDTAEQESSRVWPTAEGSSPLYAATLQNQLQYLNDRMHETSDTANRVLTRFVFGGMIAVIALLNADLILFREPPRLGSAGTWALLLAAAVVVFALSYVYFHTVQQQYFKHRVSHRKLKYKYELTLYALLTPSTPAEYGRAMELSLDSGVVAEDPPFPGTFGFTCLSAYLFDHHRFSLKKKEKSERYIAIALLLVAITFIVRIVGAAIRREPEIAKPTQVDVSLRQVDSAALALPRRP